jgi:carbonic anhydrase
MTRMTPLLERNARFAAGYSPIALAPPRTGLLIVTCMEHRVDPAVTLGITLGDTPVIRNTGGRVTDAVIADIAYIGFLAEQFFAAQLPDDQLFEVAVVHHTQCGTGFLADSAFRAQVAAASGLEEPVLAAYAVVDPFETVRTDVDRLLESPRISPKISASGHVYDIETGRLTVVTEARHRSVSSAAG